MSQKFKVWVRNLRFHQRGEGETARPRGSRPVPGTRPYRDRLPGPGRRFPLLRRRSRAPAPAALRPAPMPGTGRTHLMRPRGLLEIFNAERGWPSPSAKPGSRELARRAGAGGRSSASSSHSAGSHGRPWPRGTGRGSARPEIGGGPGRHIWFWTRAAEAFSPVAGPLPAQGQDDDHDDDDENDGPDADIHGDFLSLGG